MRDVMEAADHLMRADEGTLRMVVHHDPDMVRDVAAALIARQAAESRLSSVAGLVEAATALAPVQDPELPPDAHCILTVRLSASSTVKMPLGEWGKFMALREALDALGQ